jgi:translation initiation factor 1
MADRKPKRVLFLCTGNYYRSRFAEVYFNSVAQKMGLPWIALSKGLALERGVNNVGPMALTAIQALEKLGVRAAEHTTRFPAQATADDFEAADLVVALKHAEHLPLLMERFPAWAEKVEFWHVDDAPIALTAIENEVMTLIARILGGGQAVPSVLEPTTPIHEPAKKAIIVKVGRETKGRRGKGVTTVSEVPLDETGLAELAATLRTKCGTGGTVKDGRIEIQGDQRDRVTAVLEGLGYRVKRVGG